MSNSSPAQIDEPADARVAACGRQQRRAAPVAADERDVLELERVEELGDELHLRPQPELGVRAHRAPVRAERQRGEDAAKRAQAGQHLAPQRVIHQQPVQQHDGRAVAAGVLVLDRPCAQLDLGHVRHLRQTR